MVGFGVSHHEAGVRQELLAGLGTFRAIGQGAAASAS